MRKLLIITLMLITLGFIVGCSGDVATQNTQTAPASPASPSAEPPVPTDKSTNIEEIVDIDEYSYIGIGQANSIATSKSLSSSSKVVMLGMKNDGKVEVVHFKDAKGQISKDPHITANMSSGIFDFYKISFDSSTYYGTDFASAAGNIYCVCTTNGKIYKLDDVTSIDTGFGTYDYYDGVFVGSLTFNGTDKRVCKIYLDASKLKVDKKLSLSDFPEFEHVMMDRAFNIFALGGSNAFKYGDHTWNFLVSYVLTYKDNLIKTPGLGAFLGFNRVMYCNRCVPRDLGQWDDENNPRLSYADEITNYYSEHPTANSDLYITYLKDLANISTSDFMPPELCDHNFSSCYSGSRPGWGFSKELFHIGNTYYYLTEYTSYNPGEPAYYLQVITFSDSSHLNYSIDYDSSQGYGSSNGDLLGIRKGFVVSDKKIFYITSNAMKCVDIVEHTVSDFSPAGIISFHSIDKVNGNEVAFEGTNTSAQRVYYKINTDTLEIENLGAVPSFESVSFSPIKRI